VALLTLLIARAYHRRVSVPNLSNLIDE